MFLLIKEFLFHHEKLQLFQENSTEKLIPDIWSEILNASILKDRIKKVLFY